MAAKKPKLFKFPKGFTKHPGDGCPVNPDTFIEAIIRTAEGFGSSGVTRARLHDWTAEAHEPQKGLGEVVGYRLAQPGEAPRFSATERF